MEMLLGFIVLLACLIIGVQHGGIGLAAVSGVGLVIFTFVWLFGHPCGQEMPISPVTKPVPLA